MGAWGHQAFENDDAMDWLAEIETTTDDGVLAATFEAILAADDHYADLPEATNGLAAAELVAALLEKPSPSLPDAAVAWIAECQTVQPEVVKQARTAVQQVLSHSELKDLWAESDSDSIWRASVEDLLQRLS